MRQATLFVDEAQVRHGAIQPFDATVEIIESGIRQPAESEPAKQAIAGVAIDEDDLGAGHEAPRDQQVLRIETRDPVDQRLVHVHALAHRSQIALTVHLDFAGRDVIGGIDGGGIEAIVARALHAIAQDIHPGLVGEQGGNAFDAAARGTDEQDRRVLPRLPLRLGDGCLIVGRHRFKSRQGAGQAALRFAEETHGIAILALAVAQLAEQVLAGTRQVGVDAGKVDGRQQLACRRQVTVAQARAGTHQGQLRIVRRQRHDRFGQFAGRFEFAVAFAGAHQFECDFGVRRFHLVQALPVGHGLGRMSAAGLDARARSPPARLFGEIGNALVEQGEQFAAATQFAE